VHKYLRKIDLPGGEGETLRKCHHPTRIEMGKTEWRKGKGG